MKWPLGNRCSSEKNCQGESLRESPFPTSQGIIDRGPAFTWGVENRTGLVLRPRTGPFKMVPSPAQDLLLRQRRGTQPVTHATFLISKRSSEDPPGWPRYPFRRASWTLPQSLIHGATRFLLELRGSAPIPSPAICPFFGERRRPKPRSVQWTNREDSIYCGPRAAPLAAELRRSHQPSRVSHSARPFAPPSTFHRGHRRLGPTSL